MQQAAPSWRSSALEPVRLFVWLMIRAMNDFTSRVTTIRWSSSWRVAESYVRMVCRARP
jgi:hypothetical protein